MLGRHRKALAELGRLFKNGRVGKTYWAVVEGGPAEDEGRIELPLGRLDATRGWWMKHDPARPAGGDDLEVLGRTRSPDGERAAENGIPAESGRARSASPGSRSSRSPAAPINCACTAPPWAGRSSATRSTATRRAAAGPALHLHAREIVVPLYKNREPIRVSAPVPPHMHERLDACGWTGEVFRLVD